MTISDTTNSGKIDGGKELAWWIGWCWTAGDRSAYEGVTGQEDISFSADG